MGYAKKDNLGIKLPTAPKAADQFLTTFCKKTRYSDLQRLATSSNPDVAEIWEVVLDEAENIGLEAVGMVKNYLEAAYDTEYDGSAWFTGNLRASLYLDGTFATNPFDCDIEFDEDEFLREKTLTALKDLEGTYKVTGRGKGRWGDGKGHRIPPEKKTVKKTYTKYKAGAKIQITGYDYRGRVPTPDKTFIMTWYDETKKNEFRKAGL